MYIHEAVERAIALDACISRESWKGFRFRVQPTDTPDFCVCRSSASRSLMRCWNPKASDLLAKDWIVVSKESGSEYPEDVEC